MDTFCIDPITKLCTHIIGLFNISMLTMNNPHTEFSGPTLQKKENALLNNCFLFQYLTSDSQNLSPH